MKRLLVPALSVLAVAAASCGSNTVSDGNKNTIAVADSLVSTALADSTGAVLSEAEKAEGWQLLFDGHTLDGWRTYKNKPADSWVAEKGILHCLGNKTDKSDKRGSLITDKQFENFELTADWRLSPQGNSGIMYMVTEEFETPQLSGPEYQIIDDKNFPEKLEPWQRTGANYAMNPPLADAANPIGEWNTTKIIVNKGHVEHWLNGKKTADYELWTPEWKKHKEEGKWKDARGYGLAKKGHIALQDHGSEIWFKNLKIREL
jgi:3-keto-disaccharide hydrolase